MTKQTNWDKNILTWGVVLMGLGMVLAVAGFFLPRLASGIVLPDGMVIGFSLILFVMGIASLAQYAYVRSNPKAGLRMMIDEHDERMKLIRARAGHSAFLLSSALAFAVLIYFSFAEDVGLPTLSGNASYFSLLTVVVVPYLAYIGRIAVDRTHS